MREESEPPRSGGGKRSDKADLLGDINEMAASSQARLVQQKQVKQASKRLMTSLRLT